MSSIQQQLRYEVNFTFIKLYIWHVQISLQTLHCLSTHPQRHMFFLYSNLASMVHLPVFFASLVLFINLFWVMKRKEQKNREKKRKRWEWKFDDDLHLWNTAYRPFELPGKAVLELSQVCPDRHLRRKRGWHF